jgi:leucine dehydrogenase
MLDWPFDKLDESNPDHCLFWSDPACGLRAILVIDSLVLGPAAGGIRTWTYSSPRELLRDALSLARAMTHKCALAGLAAGGGKVVVWDRPELNRPVAFARLGQRIEALGGLFRTAGDLGTGEQDLNALARHTQYVHLRGSFLAAATARGVLRCIEACAEVGGRGGVEGLNVAIQGCGTIGSAVAKMLSHAGAQLVLADTDAPRAERLARTLRARVVPPGEILAAPVDVLAPCAVGQVITVETAPQVRAWAVCGAANNILASDEAGRLLKERGVLYVPDLIASAGAVIDGIGASVMGLEDRSSLIDRLGETARKVLHASLGGEQTTTELARAMAIQRLGKAAPKAANKRSRNPV